MKRMKFSPPRSRERSTRNFWIGAVRRGNEQGRDGGYKRERPEEPHKQPLKDPSPCAEIRLLLVLVWGFQTQLSALGGPSHWAAAPPCGLWVTGPPSFPGPRGH